MPSKKTPIQEPEQIHIIFIMKQGVNIKGLERLENM
jgi:hypothetical protein